MPHPPDNSWPCGSGAFSWDTSFLPIPWESRVEGLLCCHSTGPVFGLVSLESPSSTSLMFLHLSNPPLFEIPRFFHKVFFGSTNPVLRNAILLLIGSYGFRQVTALSSGHFGYSSDAGHWVKSGPWARGLHGSDSRLSQGRVNWGLSRVLHTMWLNIAILL